MATQYAFGKIVTDGLVLALDAADKNSLPAPFATNLNLYSQNSLNGYSFGGMSSYTTGYLAPDGTNTAVLMIEDTANTIHRWYAGIPSSFSNNTLYTFSVYVKSAGRSKGVWFNEWPSGRVGINYDLDAGTAVPYLTGTNTLYTSSITNVGNGWFRLSYTSQDTSSLVANAIYDLRLANDSNAFTYTGNGLSGSYFWGVQVEANSYMTPYIPTNGSTATRNTWYNVTGNGLDGTSQGSPYYTSSYNGGLTFLSSSTYISTNITASSPSISPTTYEIAFIPATGSINQLAGLMGYSEYPTKGFSLNIYNNNIILVQAYSGSTDANIFESAGPFSFNSVNICTAVFENRKNTYYINGKLFASSSYSFDIPATSTPIRIGGYSQGGWSQSQCTVFYARMYNRALSASEVQQNYNAQKSRFGLT